MEKIDENKYWIWLSLIENLGIKRQKKLIEKFKNPEKIYNSSKNELIKINGIGENLVNLILNKKFVTKTKENIEYMKENNIKIITINDKEYPKRLKRIYDSPLVLYMKGNEKILNEKGIGIIGCRDCSKYGEDCAKYYGYNLAKKGINIISGLAKGIDSYSHIGTLKANGKAIAILGNGLDTIYPKENIELAKEIIKKGGTIISEYPIGTKPLKINFPARNRIVSGISEKILVVEAKEKSGTLITVDFALEQGKDVYVVPGNINSINSIGTNRLIKEGAIPTNCYEDLIN